MDEEVQKHMIEAVAESGTREVLNFCIRKIATLPDFKVSSLQAHQDQHIKECINNFAYSSVIVSETWLATLSKGMASSADTE